MKRVFFIAAILVIFYSSCEHEFIYHVYYHGNGAVSGEVPKDSRDYSSGDTVRVLGKGNLMYEDYSFLGWRDNDMFYSPGDFITMGNYDINLYAVWDDGSEVPFSYRIDNQEVTITRYNETNTYASIIIPNTLQSLPVTAIEDNVFSNLGISSVTLPRSLKKIGAGAFASNILTLVIIPDSVKSIGVGAFRNNDLTKVTLGNGLSAIEPYVFSNNKIKDITIPDNIRLIESGVFNYNDIDMIKISAGVTIKSDNSFGTYGASFREFYDLEKEAGLYLYIGSDTWERY